MATPLHLRSRLKGLLGLDGKTHLAPGDAAPEIDAVDQDGQRWTLAALRGKPAVVYFYPKDDTPGCTREACDFRDQGAALGATVLGVSGDDAPSHRAFISKFNLGFPLIVDSDGAVATRFGAWNDGRARRATFVIDRDGRVAAVFDPVKVDGHVAEVKAALAAL